MTVAKDLAQMAVECGRKPGRESIWLRELGKYVCPDSEEEKGALLQSDRPPILHEERQHPALGPQFKLVFFDFSHPNSFVPRPMRGADPCVR